MGILPKKKKPLTFQDEPYAGESPPRVADDAQKQAEAARHHSEHGKCPEN